MLKIKRLLLFPTLFLLFSGIEVQGQKINQCNENGEREGIWRKTYKNGKIRYEGQFKNGKEIGVFKYYDIKAPRKPVMIKKFSKHSDSAEVKFYTLLGKLKTKGTMVGKKRVGKWSYFFTNGKLLSEEFYKNGELDGVLKNYYSNGQVTEESNYKNNVKHGISKKYTEDGILIEEENYVAGKLEGPARYFDLKGGIKEKGVYKEGKRIGKWEFYMDGEAVSNSKRRRKHTIKVE
ncbi:toxin-antitoxin system YwqK family antitoxin [Tenacibaculum maritimum]|uniref:toxin-antitoxin system YwqK family antitoxin n=1 Tax=Tenacibaculum maritimum TaxID=107401 RepID=UPI003876D0EC